MRTRLVVFDLDGTLIRGDTCCELIAGRIGRLDQMRGFERCVTQREIEAARVEMSRWYSQFSEDELSQSLVGAVEAPGMRAGLDRLRAAGVMVAIASITWPFAVRWFAERLGAQFYLGTELRADKTIGHVWPEDKAEWLRYLAGSLGLEKAETAAVGDSAGDLPMLCEAGRGYYVGKDRNTWPEVIHLPGGNIDEIARELLKAD
ncbi:HAD family hydrolase [Candidatus Binatus sp.]|jgi:HAD superfamily phosphoserine phosphatase-like hydrolase|uniref:HAD family hydrolase n=1 Tax=Candidatus Binatus sp. TaxID=2811406 RepID=UPI003BCDDA7B